MPAAGPYRPPVQVPNLTARMQDYERLAQSGAGTILPLRLKLGRNRNVCCHTLLGEDAISNSLARTGPDDLLGIS